jgi:hypothetical protein
LLSPSPELISEVLERPPVTIADVKAFRREYETDGAPDNSSPLSFTTELERMLQLIQFEKNARDSLIEPPQDE